LRFDLKYFFSDWPLGAKIAGLYSLLMLATAAVWIWAALTFRAQPVFLGAALLAYGFGLRHAVDADHLAAIDNVTRKLIQQGQQPIGVGFWFALGHSTVVVLAAAAVAVGASTVQRDFAAWRSIGGALSTGISALFLFAIAAINLMILRSVWLVLRQLRSGGVYSEGDLDLLMEQRGFLARLFKPLFRLITRTWHMFPLGFLFGLGFDTATEITVLGIAATEAAKGLSIWSIMVFPALFAVGMALVDTSDGVLMLGAYAWAFMKPVRRLYYNFTITLISVAVAVAIGAIEALGLIGQAMGRPQWSGLNFSNLGLVIIGLFIVAWLGSAVIYRRTETQESSPSGG